jgi:hypothetical protein
MLTNKSSGRKKPRRLFKRSGVLRTPECGAELALPTADLFGCALIRTPEQIRWSESFSGLQACGLSPLRLRSAPHWAPPMSARCPLYTKKYKKKLYLKG